MIFFCSFHPSAWVQSVAERATRLVAATARGPFSAIRAAGAAALF